MCIADEKLRNIKQQLDNGIAPPKETVRSLLLWFNVSRRGWRVCNQIRYQLKEHGLETTPDFEYAYIDGSISFTDGDVENDATSQSGVADPTYRIGQLEAANKKPVCVKPDGKLAEAVTLMLTHDFSQLPVMTSMRDVKGIVSWKTIGSRLALKKNCNLVRECMDPAKKVGIEDSLFSTIPIIAEHDYVLVSARDKTVCGIITASDFNIQFQKLAEPFFLVGEIEKGIRQIIHGKFNENELSEAKAPGDDDREIGGVADLTFGEYIKLIESNDSWEKLELAIDRAEFLRQLNHVRQIRNDVMHFDPDGLEDTDLEKLKKFAQFLECLRDIGVV